jgi:hypothetical protein
MDRFVILYDPLVPVSHRDRVVTPVHHPCVKHDREQAPALEVFRQDHGRLGAVHTEREGGHHGPLGDALTHGRHVVRPARVVGVAGQCHVLRAAGQKLFERHLTRLARRGEHHGHEIICTGRPSTGVDGLLLLPPCENFFYKFFVDRIFKNINQVEDNLLGVMLTCTGKMWKPCCEGAVKGPRVWDLTNRPYLLDQLAKLTRHLTRSFVFAP